MIKFFLSLICLSAMAAQATDFHLLYGSGLKVDHINPPLFDALSPLFQARASIRNYPYLKKSETAYEAEISNQSRLDAADISYLRAESQEETTSLKALDTQLLAHPLDSTKQELDLSQAESDDLQFAENSESEEVFLKEKNSSSFVLSWKPVFRLKIFTGKTKLERAYVTDIYGRVKWQFLEKLFFYGEALIVHRTGFAQSIYDRRDRGSGFHPIESYFYWESPFWDIQFGNIKQDFLKAPLLVTDKTFFSLIQRKSFKLPWDIEFSAFFQTAFTGNATDFVRRNTNFSETPLFITSSVFLSKEDLPFSVDLKNHFTLFHISNLSSAMAHQSAMSGNTVDDGSASDAQFKFQFFGLYNSWSLRKLLSPQWIIEGGSDLIWNFRAKPNYNLGEIYYSSLYYNYKDFIEWKLTAEYFANQSDSGVAFFNSEIYGHNNRKGYRLVLESHFYSSGLTCGASWTWSRPVDPERTQKENAQAFGIFLKSNYMDF